MGLGMLRLEFQRPFQRALDPAAQAVRESLEHRDSLAVATQGVGLEVVGVGILRLRPLQLVAARGNGLEHLQLALPVVFQVGGMDHGCLVGCVVAVEPGRQPRFAGLLELSVVIEPPCLLHRLVGRERLAVAAMQAFPVLFQCGTRVNKCLVRMRKFLPGRLCHDGYRVLKQSNSFSILPRTACASVLSGRARTAPLPGRRRAPGSRRRSCGADR